MLGEIARKLDSGERLSMEDGVRLFEHPNLLEVAALANRERERRHGDLTYYNFNIRIEATNVCVASCLFCSFTRLKPRDHGAYTLSLEHAWDKLRARAHHDALGHSTLRARPTVGVHDVDLEVEFLCAVVPRQAVPVEN